MLVPINPNNRLEDEKTPYNEIVSSLKQAGKMLVVAKGEAILFEGETVDYVFIIEEGCFRTHRWINDEDITIGFTFMGDIDTCPYAFINQLESTDTIEALTDGKVIRIHRREIENLQRVNPLFNNFVNSLLSNYIEVLIKRNIDLRTKSAEALYKELLERQPYEVARIPLMFIASYLGITKERLSRIRKKDSQVD